MDHGIDSFNFSTTIKYHAVCVEAFMVFAIEAPEGTGRRKLKTSPRSVCAGPQPSLRGIHPGIHPRFLPGLRGVQQFGSTDDADMAALRVMNQPLVHDQRIDVTLDWMLEGSGQPANDVKAELLPEPDGALVG